MKVIIGSARVDERGKYSGGKAGDQKQKSAPDLGGEVSMQNFYIHKKGWNILRATSAVHAEHIAYAMVNACDNPNIGYDQGQRLNILKYGTKATVKTECDCSSLVRKCVLEATGKDPGNFTTANEVAVLSATKLFYPVIPYKTGTPLYNGDILVTKSKGHTVIVCQGLPRIETIDQPHAEYFPQYFGSSNSIRDALVGMGVNGSYENRCKIAAVNNIEEYSGTAAQNMKLLALLKSGKLKKPS